MAAESDGGTSIWGLLSGSASDKTFPAFFHPKLKHLERGTVSMATAPHPSDPETRLAGSQFMVTLGDNTDYLDGRAAIFGKVVEGFDVLEKINDAIIDERGHPLVDIRIKHTVVLDDPYPDPAGLREPSASPPPTEAQLATVRIAEGEELNGDTDDEEAAQAAEKRRREREAAAQALTLEMMGDLPFAEVKPPENVLFVCKLNPVTTDEDLELIFSRFGKILSCEVIRDRKTGDSLQYAFIEFDNKESCEAAYTKMDGVLIDDRRIHVDFSQSVSRLSDIWRTETNQKRKGAASGRRGGWGGVSELEKWRKYRNEGDEPEDRDGYQMVHDADDLRGRHEREKDTHRKDAVADARGPEPDGKGGRQDDSYKPGGRGHDGGGRRDADRRRSRSRSPRRDRYRDSFRDDRRGHGNRDADRRDRQDRHRDSDRDRDRHRHGDGYRTR
jgi:peptidyl-prolyl cis-trans isomerase-like 4